MIIPSNNILIIYNDGCKCWPLCQIAQEMKRVINLNTEIMSDINNEIIDYLKFEKQVRLDGLKMMDKSAEIPQRLLKEVSIFDRWIEHLANGLPTSDSGLHLQRVSSSACLHPMESRVRTHRGYHCVDCGKRF